jgi:putative ABC transport system permease protein
MDTPIQLIWGLGLLGATIVLAAVARLDAMGITTAGLRSVLQMVVLSYLLALVLAFQNVWVSAGALGLLLIVAAMLTENQIAAKLPLGLLTGGSLFVGVGLTLVYTMSVVIQPQPWHEARLWLPIGSVILANAVSSAVLAGERLIQSLDRHPAEIELRLSLGATPAMATQPYRREAIQATLSPIVRGMGVLGLGLIPTFMAGEMVGGFDPLQAGAYQLLLVFASAFASLVTVLLLCAGIQRQFLTKTGQLLRW